ncbi:helix-turn-helix domain-containing protein [Anaerovorax odorimutans]|uniref:Helix-turn-helix domain-containing protein n=1 Tax=Anaerovorax odorimutans TaxID=109327 RepID=A0ABT1RTJ8_9FIRM|nr:helix-turn-helix transcriptional regulator [Anaerovorax odorimutans]MCQ4638520.1 helix-turn-helix domain-containing protein [Anaerovorax odorimutans]
MDQCLTQDYNIGKNLRRLRKRANLTQMEVATQLQIMGLPVSREIYAQIETGRHHIKLRVLIGLKEIYNASYEELLELVEK